MNKKLLCFIITVLLFLNPLSILADVLIEPEDAFYKTHSDQCHSEKKYYEAAESAAILTSPQSKKGYDEADRGSIFYINWIYTDDNGNQWGLYDGVNDSYWVDMTHLVPVYSHDEFIEEHASEIKEESRTVNPAESGWVVLYEYPGSTWISDILETEWIGEDSLTVHQIYVDEQGVSWGYTPYYMQHNGWIHLDQPVTAAEPVRNAPEIYLPDSNPSPIPMIAGLVVIVCGLTGVVACLKRRNRK